ncbi:MAG TPA: biotin/lipoyl-containing protein [Candidatus Binataceae bacterium]|nr:biotin/lipoyl-containing protein [Candidatus Binataceae bacterium]
MRFKQPGDPHEFNVEILARDGAAIRARIDGEEIAAHLETRPGASLLRVGDQVERVTVARYRNALLVAIGPAQFAFTRVEGSGRRRAHRLAAHEVVAPMPGKVLKILVEEGQQVDHGAPLIVLEAMKMETTLAAESPAIIAKVHAVVGAMVDHGAVLIELSPPPPAVDSSAT